MSTREPGWHAGASVKISGLAKAPQHNGKIGKISAKAAEQEGRIGVETLPMFMRFLSSDQTLNIQ